RPPPAPCLSARGCASPTSLPASPSRFASTTVAPTSPAARSTCRTVRRNRWVSSIAASPRSKSTWSTNLRPAITPSAGNLGAGLARQSGGPRAPARRGAHGPGGRGVAPGAGSPGGRRAVLPPPPPPPPVAPRRPGGGGVPPPRRQRHLGGGDDRQCLVDLGIRLFQSTFR